MFTATKWPSGYHCATDNIKISTDRGRPAPAAWCARPAEMTQEEVYERAYERLQVGDIAGRGDDDDASSVCSERTRGVRDIIMRFERGRPFSGDDYDSSGDSESVAEEPRTRRTPYHLTLPYLNTPKNRASTSSVNSILSGMSVLSYGSSSASDSEYRQRLTPSRPAPPPPEPFGDNDSCKDRFPVATHEDDLEKRFTFTPPLLSPVVIRRARQPPVMRRKSLAESKDLNTHWSYGLRQSDLDKVLRIRRLSENGGCENGDCRKDKRDQSSRGESDVEEENASDAGQGRDESEVTDEDPTADAVSTDRSTDTLIDEDAINSDTSDSMTVASDLSENRNEVDNLSIKSISSLDNIPYHNPYDSITVSSDEFGSEVCHAPDSEFLSVSAVNEWCVNKNSDPGAIPRIESKKEKYRRRLTERVNELIHTESLYVEKLRHVVRDYIPELCREGAPPALRAMRFDIFGNIDKMLRFHEDFLLPDLRAAEHDLKKLGQCFRRHEQKFNMYVMYSRNNKRAVRLVYEYKQFFQEKQMELGERLDLSSYLLEPVQRIPRYKLFLDELVKTYQNYESEREDSESLKSKASLESDETGGSNGGSEGEETTLQSLVMAKSMIETLLVNVDNIIALENIRDCPINPLSQGKLLRQHDFTVTDPAKRRHHMRVFLFEKLVLLTAVYKKQLTVEVFVYRDHIPTDELGLTAKEHDRHKFTVWYRKRDIKKYKLETHEPAVRAAWVEEISALLWKQAVTKKELLMQSRSARNSVISVTSQQSSEGDPEPPLPADKYNSLRGVPGEVRRGKDKREARRTTWYYE